MLAALAGWALWPPPAWLMRQAGRYLPEYRATRAKAGAFLSLCTAPELAAEVTLQPIRRYGFDAAILFSDILIVPWALGQKLWFAEGEGPRLDPIRDAAGFAALGRADMAGSFGGVVAPILETVRRVRAGLAEAHPATTLIGFAGSPWTVACYMVEGAGSREFLAVKGLAYRDPALFAALTERLVDATIAYLSAQVDAGAEVLQLFESWAGILSEPQFRRWVIEPTRAIVAALKARHPGVPVIGFPRGAGWLIEAYARETGIDAIGLDTTVPPGWAAGRLPAHLALQGNLDPVALLTGGKALTRETQVILGAMRGRPFIFNLGHGIHKDTPPEHVAALLRLVRAT
ncbi:MAG: uroporphyrinogen decarboxylase [Alphaproteobacteria bacterium]|nr:uroporphyrinogen decarboxylase [Alphaproteobacteria bacterium]